MINEFDDEEGEDLLRNVDIEEQILLPRAQKASGSASQQVTTLTSRIHQLDEQVSL